MGSFVQRARGAGLKLGLTTFAFWAKKSQKCFKKILCHGAQEQNLDFGGSLEPCAASFTG